MVMVSKQDYEAFFTKIALTGSITASKEQV